VPLDPLLAGLLQAHERTAAVFGAGYARRARPSSLGATGVASSVGRNEKRS
jgi:hypothetical protein